MPEDKVPSEEEEPEAPEGMISITDFLNAAKLQVQEGMTGSVFFEQPAAIGGGVTTTKKKPVSENQLGVFVAESLAKVGRTREKMARDQAEIDQLKRETRMMISKLLAA